MQPHVLIERLEACNVPARVQLLVGLLDFLANTPFTLGHVAIAFQDGVLKRDCRGCRARILNCQKFYHGSHSAYHEERCKTG